YRMDRLAALGNRLREVAADDAFDELADRLLRRDVGDELRHDRSNDALLGGLDAAIRDGHRLYANVPVVFRDDVDRQVRPRPLAAGEPAELVRRHDFPLELGERVLALDLAHSEQALGARVAEFARHGL